MNESREKQVKEKKKNDYREIRELGEEAAETATDVAGGCLFLCSTGAPFFACLSFSCILMSFGPWPAMCAPSSPLFFCLSLSSLSSFLRDFAFLLPSVCASFRFYFPLVV